MSNQIGNYRLVRPIGKGGFGKVYLAEHIHLQTPAAVKLLLQQVNEAAFLQEARTIASLRHPRIIRILDFGIIEKDEDGFRQKIPYLITEYAPNGTLRQQHPHGSRVPGATVAAYLEQIAEGLQYAHDRHIIHRDIKPENLLLDEEMRVVISDFGLALHGSRQLTEKEIVGTLTYMPPEQLAGKPKRASDQYALGIMVYEWLTGTAPFRGSSAELIGQHHSTQPPSLRDQHSDISRAVEQVVLRALAKDPTQRFPSVQAFAAAFAQAMATTQGTSTRRIPPVAHTALPPVPIAPTQDGRATIPIHPPSSGQQQSRQLPIIWQSTLREAIRDLGPDFKVLVRRPRTPGFLVTHPIRFFSGKRWVRADRIDGVDALDIDNTLSCGQEVPVKKKGGDIITIRQALQSAAESSGSLEARELEEQRQNATQSSPWFVFPLLNLAWAISWITWFVLMYTNGNSIGEMLMLRWGDYIPQQSWTILLSCILLFFGWSWLAAQTLNGLEADDAVYYHALIGIILLTWTCSGCMFANMANVPFGIGSLIVGVVFPGLLLCVFTVPVGIAFAALGAWIGEKLRYEE